MKPVRHASPSFTEGIRSTRTGGWPRAVSGLSDAQFALTIVGSILLLNTLIVIVPIGYSLWLSFHESNVILKTLEFVGLRNYARVVTDPEVQQATFISLEFAAIAVVLSLAFSLAFALVLNEEFPGRGLLRALVLMPWAVSEVATATMWIMLLNPTFGAFNGLLSTVGLATTSTIWLSAHWAIFWAAVAFVWHIAPLGAFFFLAALQTIPRDLYNAAKIDRAGPLARFRYVTLPHIKYAVLIVLVVVTVESIREFDLLFSMTRGGPGTATQILPLLIFRYNFEFSQYGLASSASYVLIVIATLLSIAYFVLLSGRKRQIPGAEAKVGVGTA